MAQDLAKKMLVKSGQRVFVHNAPASYKDSLANVTDVEFVVTFDGPLDAVHLFVKDRSELDEWMANVQHHVHPDTLLWIGYPKKSSKLKSDLHRDVLWDIMHQIGWDGVTLISVDDIWSAMRFRPTKS
jgi:hypothetical protein